VCCVAVGRILLVLVGTMNVWLMLLRLVVKPLLLLLLRGLLLLVVHLQRGPQTARRLLLLLLVVCWHHSLMCRKALMLRFWDNSVLSLELVEGKQEALIKVIISHAAAVSGKVAASAAFLVPGQSAGITP
jgi:hypothetical protein